MSDKDITPEPAPDDDNDGAEEPGIFRKPMRNDTASDIVASEQATVRSADSDSREAIVAFSGAMKTRIDREKFGQHAFGSVRVENHKLKVHELAKLFPEFTPDEQVRLVADMKENGVQDPITLLDGAILDGQNRYIAARKAGVPIHVRDYRGNDPLGYLVSANLMRRHLSESQRAMLGARLATMNRGARTDLAEISARSQSEAAALVSASRGSLQNAVLVQRRGTQELIAAVIAGKATVWAASKVARLPEAEQARVVAGGRKAITAFARAPKIPAIPDIPVPAPAPVGGETPGSALATPSAATHADARGFAQWLASRCGDGGDKAEACRHLEANGVVEVTAILNDMEIVPPDLSGPARQVAELLSGLPDHDLAGLTVTDLLAALREVRRRRRA